MAKLTMFCLFMFIIVSIAGNVMQGQSDFARNHLTAAINDTATTIPVASTSGFPATGIVVIEQEQIAYSAITGTTFYGTLAQPLVRGTSSTLKAAHANGKQVATVSGAIFNTSASYYVAVIVDSAGLQAFVAKPLAAIQLFGSFLFLPLQFLGTDLQILTIIWSVFGIGTLISFFIMMAGGRRV